MCNCLIGTFGELFVNGILSFNYDLIMVYSFSHINSFKSHMKSFYILLFM
jgi:hypothetical protein